MKFIIIILSVSLFYSVNLYGQNDDSLNLFDLPFEEFLNIKITTSSKFSEKLLETPTPVYIVTEEDIQLLNFNTLQEVLEYINGMSSINGEANFFTTTTIRGNTLVNYNTNTLLLYDGIPIQDAYGGSFNFQAIPLSSIKKIEIIKGSNSVLYGSNAINAVINIIPKTQEQPNKEVSISGKLSLGSYSNLHAENAVTYRKDKLSFNFFMDLNYNEGEKLTYNDELGNELSFKKMYKGNAISSSLAYGDFKFHLQFFNRSELAVRTREFNRIYTNIDDTIGTLVNEPNNEYMIISSVQYKHKVSEQLTINFRSNVNKWENTKLLPDGYWNYSSLGVYNDLHLSYTPSEKWKNIIGINYNTFIGRRFKSQINDYDVGKYNIWTNEFSAYLNGNYELFKKLNIFYGGRYFVSKYSDVVFDNFSPRLAINYRPYKFLALKFIHGHSFRVPTYFEKEVFSDKVIGNPNLKPEKSLSYDFVIMTVFKTFQADINFFHNWISDQIKRVDVPNNPDEKINMNTGTSEYYGIELNTKIFIKKNFYAYAGYYYTDGQADNYEQQLFIYKHTFNLGVSGKIIPNITITSSLKYLSNWGEAPAYTLWNAAIAYRISNKKPLYINFQANNILDEDVLRPEIARIKEEVPTYPLTENTKYFISFMYKF